eukprot:3344337-Pyramimonas_sp.AAC.1
MDGPLHQADIRGCEGSAEGGRGAIGWFCSAYSWISWLPAGETHAGVFPATAMRGMCPPPAVRADARLLCILGARAGGDPHPVRVFT